MIIRYYMSKTIQVPLCKILTTTIKKGKEYTWMQGLACFSYGVPFQLG